MKILHLIETSGPGGAEKVLLSLAKNLNKNYDCSVGLIKNGWLYGKLKENGIKAEIIPPGGLFDLKLIRNLVTHIKGEKIDLIHSHLLDMNFYSSIAAKFTGTPHISTEHGDVHHFSKRMDFKTRLKIKILAKFSNKLVFVSNFTKRQFLKIANLPEEKTSIIYNGIDIDEYQKPIDKNKKKGEIGIKEDEFVIGNIANLYPVKGQIYLLRAAKKVLKEIPNTKFLIIGRGELENELKREAQNLGIVSYVKFLGFREDVKELYKIMDVFVLSSLTEGLPLSLIEAMASKVPVVATDVGGIPEVIDDGVNGLLVPPSDPEALSTKINFLLRNNSLAEKLVIQGGKKFKQQFSITIMQNKYNDIYSMILR
jgi:glycosyltransferase involved in cell wall biosynthesis